MTNQTSDPSSTIDLDQTIEMLQADYAAKPTEIVVLAIERWEHELQGTALFDDLSQLKQAILSANTSDIAHKLVALGESTTAATDVPVADAEKVKQLGALLTQIGNSLMRQNGSVL